jgi:hypothetical protein
MSFPCCQRPDRVRSWTSAAEHHCARPACQPLMPCSACHLQLTIIATSKPQLLSAELDARHLGVGSFLTECATTPPCRPASSSPSAGVRLLMPDRPEPFIHQAGWLPGWKGGMSQAGRTPQIRCRLRDPPRKKGGWRSAKPAPNPLVGTTAPENSLYLNRLERRINDLRASRCEQAIQGLLQQSA